MCFLSRGMRWARLALLLACGSISSAQTAPPAPPAPASPPANGASAPAPPINDWPVTTAPARFLIEAEKNQPVSDVSSIRLCFSDPNWANCTVRFFTDKGLAVGSEMIWSAPGEAATYVFDSSSHAKGYWVYVGSNWPALPLPNRKAGVWVETRAGDGTVIAHLDDMLKAWSQSHQVLGRAVTNGIFEGGNRFGPQVNLMIHLQAYFKAEAQETLQLGIVSSNSTFVLVDGKEVAEWPGRHGWGYGPDGPPQGTVQLSPGLHTIDYYNAYVATPDGSLPVMACLIAKGGTLPGWTMLMPDQHFFVPLTPYRVDIYELQNAAAASSALQRAPPIGLEWSNDQQSVITSDQADVGLIGMLFNIVNRVNYDTADWTFDDGGTAEGHHVVHLYLRPGIRSVSVTLKKAGVILATFERKVDVHPAWAEPWRGPDLHPEQVADILARDLATQSGPDLSSAFIVLGFYQQTDALLKLLPALCAKFKDVPGSDLARVKDSAMYLLREDVTHFPDEIQLLQQLADRATAITPQTPELATTIADCQLALARLTLKTTDQVDAVGTLVNTINRPALQGSDPRVLDILKADLLCARGDVTGARAAYTALTGDPTGPDERSSIRRTAKIAQARTFIDRKDFQAAEDSLNEVAWNSPIDKLAPDWALTRLRLYEEEGLTDAAYLYARRLMPFVTESGRTELLYRLTDLAYTKNDRDLAGKTLSELLQKHPFSAEAALAKQKWPATP